MPAMSALDRCKFFGVANIQGIAYMPGPSDYTQNPPGPSPYFDSDFYNLDFEYLWGQADSGLSNARKDLQRFRDQLGINFIHCYDWSAPATQIGLRNHLPFLVACNTYGMKATIPISNYTLLCLANIANKPSWENPDTAHQNIQQVFHEIYSGGQEPATGAGMWKIFNEYELWYDQDPEHVVTAITWIVQEEDNLQLSDGERMPVMLDCSFGTKDDIQGAAYAKDVWDRLMAKPSIGSYTPLDFWNARFVFSTNPQNDGPDVADYLSNRLPNYWTKYNIPAPPVMFTELGSNMTQTGSEELQAEWMTRQIAASRPGSSNGMMLGACVFLNEERPWMTGPELTFGIMRFGASQEWPYPNPSPYVAQTKFPRFDSAGNPYAAQGTYQVEQQVAKLNYAAVAQAWKG